MMSNVSYGAGSLILAVIGSGIGAGAFLFCTTEHSYQASLKEGQHLRSNIAIYLVSLWVGPRV